MPLDTQAVNGIIQLGAVGVLILFGIAAVILVWKRPSKSSTDTVLVAMASLSDKQFIAAATAEKKREEREEEYRADRKEQTERFIASIDRQTIVLQTISSVNTSVDAKLDTNRIDVTAVRDAVNQLATVGSVPLQDVQQKVTHIYQTISEQWITQDRQLKESIQQQLNEVTAKLALMQSRIRTNEVIKTGEVDRVVITPKETT